MIKSKEAIRDKGSMDNLRTMIKSIIDMLTYDDKKLMLFAI